MSDPEEQTAVVLMERALASRDPLELAIAGFLSAYKGRTFVKHRRLLKQYIDWCIQNDLAPLAAKRPHTQERPACTTWRRTTGTVMLHTGWRRSWPG